jgi:hypothetical protein
LAQSLKRIQAWSSHWTSRTRGMVTFLDDWDPLATFSVSLFQEAPLQIRRWREALAQHIAPLKRNRRRKSNRLSSRKVMVLLMLSHGRPRRLLCL